MRSLTTCLGGASREPQCRRDRGGRAGEDESREAGGEGWETVAGELLPALLSGLSTT